MLSIADNLSSRLQMVEALRPGGSTTKLRPSSHTGEEVGHSTLWAMVDPEAITTCKSGALTRIGGNSSDTEAITSLMFRTERFSHW